MDSSATLGLVHRTGLGKAKHIDILRMGRLTVNKIWGHDNGADLMTKALDGDRIRYLMDILGYVGHVWHGHQRRHGSIRALSVDERFGDFICYEYAFR